MMDKIMEAEAMHERLTRPLDFKPQSPKAEPCDNDGENIFLDNYFDHSQQLEGDELDALLRISLVDDDGSSSLSSKTITQWRPAHSTVDSHLPETTTTQMESLSHNHGHSTFRPSSSSDASPAFQHQHNTFQAPLNAASNYQSLPNRMYPPSPYGQPVSTLQHQSQPQPGSFGNLQAHVSHGQYFQNSGPVALPTMNDSYHDMASQPFYNDDYLSPDHMSRQGTADLMDCDNTIPQQDEAGEGISGDIAEPCYAQLLYKCLREAPDHTMSLKQVYEWVRRRSQKARSNGTGWQNSVRHNLSMNAAFERVTASALHGAKKGSLWRLTNRALQEGVISTTRYRKDPKRKPERRSSPALKRQSAGAKGGQATRAATQQRKALLQANHARITGNPNQSGMARHRRDIRRQDQAFFTPTSMPSSNHASPSPQPGWHGLPTSIPHHNPLPPSPYYLHSVENEPFSMMPPQSLSNPHTPDQIHVGFAEPSKTMASPPTAFGSPSKGLTEFELSFHDHVMGGLFGNDPNTPSLETEMSFVTDDMTPNSMRLSISVEPTRS